MDKRIRQLHIKLYQSYDKIHSALETSCIFTASGIGFRSNKGHSIHFRLPDFVVIDRMETIMACKKTNKAASAAKAVPSVKKAPVDKAAPAAKAAPSVKKATCKRKTAVAAKACAVPVAESKKEESKKECVVLTVQAAVGSKVYLAGSFNNWNPTEIEMTDKDGSGVYTAAINLDPGIYEYKFVINGTWSLDPDPDRDWTQNGLGTLNSVLRV